MSEVFVDADALIACHSIDRCLAEESLQTSGRIFLRVAGSSMMPSLWPGDLLTLERREINQVSQGDMAVFFCNKMLVVHRVVLRRASYLITQGDTALAPDAPVTEDRLLGVVASVLRNGKQFTPARTPSLASRAIAGLVRRSRLVNKALQRAYAMTTSGKAPLGAKS